MTNHALLSHTAALAAAYLDALPSRFVNTQASREELTARLAGDLPNDGADPIEVIDALVRDASSGLVASAGPRYFGFVTGGSGPASLASDWLASAWDQNVGLYVQSPALAVIEEVTARWLTHLLGLPLTASVGFVTGCHMANFTALAAARHETLRRAGWDVEADGLTGAPPIDVFVGDEVHVSVLGALRMLGLGARRAARVAVDGQGRMDPADLASKLDRRTGPTIVCAQAGNVNTGAVDPLASIASITRGAGAWLHVDGAFGLWASAAPSLCELVDGVEAADSWATDAHKWLNVPYDSGIVATAHPAAHRAAMSLTASYLVRGDDERRDGMDWAPESSRRARALPIYAALKSLGRQGVADMVERCCRLARRMADHLRSARGIAIANDVVLNQVLARVDVANSDDGDRRTRAVIERVQRGGVCWLGGATWRGRAVMRISICNWSTSQADIDASAAAILEAFEAVTREGS